MMISIPPRVLLLDDDQSLRILIQRFLKREGFSVTAVGCIADFNQALNHIGADVCIIDWMLGGENGLDLVNRLAATIDAPPVLMLSAKSSLDEKINGLSVADDYLSKPFEPRELIARLRALLRRKGIHGNNKFKIKNLVIDLERKYILNNDVLIELTTDEWIIFVNLMNNPGKIFSRDRLLTVLRDVGDNSERAVDVKVSRLRKKLADYAYLLETVWGQGYRFRDSVDK
jgi:DNA-binding response OmpR family regulator